MEYLSATVLEVKVDQPLCVAIDGVDAAGKLPWPMDFTVILSTTGRSSIIYWSLWERVVAGVTRLRYSILGTMARRPVNFWSRPKMQY